MDLRCTSCIEVPIHSNITTLEEFITTIQEKRKPAIIRKVDVGKCCENWSSEYLVDKIGHLETKIHVSADNKLDFLNKNFLYKTLSMAETIKRASQDTHEDYFVHPKEYYYLRSLSSERRGREVSDIRKQFPEIANDIKIPSFFHPEDFFSSVFRVSSKGLQLWTHYDIMDNLLIQVRGRKRVVLFDPSDVNLLYMEGDKSRVLDIDNPDLKMFPEFVKAKQHNCILDPGDILFIPALWFHNTLALTYGVAVNVFWKNLKHDLYDKNDFYGNKDLLPATKALQSVETAARLLCTLPEQYKDFYLKRCLKNIEKHLKRSDNDQ